MNWNIRSAYVRPVTAGLATVALALLAGCGVSKSTPSTDYDAPVLLQGQVFAGRNYMGNATVKVYATQPNGVATNGTYVGTAKLLATVEANGTGTWSLPASGISCSSPDQLYVTAEGGKPYVFSQSFTNQVNNPKSLMMTAIGDCSLLGSTSGTNNVTSIVTNEATTVAAVYGLRNFISLNGTTVNVTSSPTNYTGTDNRGVPGNYAGLLHGFENANNLAPFKIGNFTQHTNSAESDASGGINPVHELNSLAYAQYLCTIGSDGTSPGSTAYCDTLFTLTTPPGGTAPTNTLQAMLNIATYPTNNVIDILNFSLTPIPLSNQTGAQQNNAGVYVPYLGACPVNASHPGGIYCDLTAQSGVITDWSVAIYYQSLFGATATGQGLTYPAYMTIDANDDAYVSNSSASTSFQGNIIAISHNGELRYTTDNDQTNLIQPRVIAADASGHLWVPNGSTPSFVREIDAATGATLADFPSTESTLYGLAVDSLGNIWYAGNTTATNIHELVKSGTNYAETSFTGVNLQLLQIRPDANNNIWAAGYSTSTGEAVYLPNTGTAAAPTYPAIPKISPLTGNANYGITVDAAGNAYSATIGTPAINKTTVTGTGNSATLATTNVGTQPAAATRFMDTDGMGNIWYLDNTTGTHLYQYVPATGDILSYYPCYIAASTSGTGTATATNASCGTGMSTKLDLTVDSTGSVWVASYGNAAGGRIVQILGVAAPTVPLRAAGKAGIMP